MSISARHVEVRRQPMAVALYRIVAAHYHWCGIMRSDSGTVLPIAGVDLR